jgi:hypothetical protein
MSCHVVVAAAPMVACAPEKTWRAAAVLLERQLRERFGPTVKLDFVELFTPDVDRHPEIEAQVAAGAVPPIVLIDGVLHSSGGKLHLSAIGRAVAERLALSVGEPEKELVS